MLCECACYTGESKLSADVSDDKTRPFLCTVCDKRFTRKQGLTKHRELHTGVMYTCSQCEKVFASQSGLCHHVNIHTSKYKCSVCGKCCGSSHRLAVHRLSHSGEKLFECAVCSKRFSRDQVTLLCTAEFTVERNRTNVTCVTRHLDILEIWTLTWESTQVTNHTNVHCVTRCLVVLKVWTVTWESTRVTNHTNVTCVTNVSLCPAPCRYINFVYTATVVHMNVLSVENGLRQTRIWNSMFVFTLMQSRTHVDTVLVVLHGMSNSRHICWSHTMKVLGSLVTFVTRNSPPKVNLSSTYFDMKMWSRMFAVNVQSVSIQQVNWHVISQCTLTTNSFAVVYVVKTLNVNIMLNHTLRDVLLSWELLTHGCTWAVTECCYLCTLSLMFLSLNWSLVDVVLNLLLLIRSDHLFACF